MAPRWPQDGPKMAPRWPQDPQDGPKTVPRQPEDGPKTAQDGPKAAPALQTREFRKSLGKSNEIYRFSASNIAYFGLFWGLAYTLETL